MKLRILAAGLLVGGPAPASRHRGVHDDRVVSPAGSTAFDTGPDIRRGGTARALSRVPRIM